MFRTFAFLWPVFLLGGCSLSHDIARQAIDYNEAVETAANTLLLRNILRARDEMPMHFTTIPQIRGSVNLGIGQPGATIPLASGLGSAFGLGIAAGSSPSFDVSALDTQEFTRGLLEPLEPQVFRYYLERGYPEELLLFLFLSSIEGERGGNTTRMANDPRCLLDQPGCPSTVAASSMSSLMRATMGRGLFIFHDYLSLEPLGPPLLAARAGDPALLALLAEPRLRLLPIPGGQFQLYRAVRQVAACRRVTIGDIRRIVPLYQRPQ